MRGRIRSIKPELFTDEKLWDLGQETGLPVLQAFEGLWCFADREGRFEWRPRALKALILPYWDGDLARVMDALATRGFLVRYTCNGREYGAVRNFLRHQTPNNKENPSTIPPPPESNAVTDTSTRDERVRDALPTRESPPSIQKESSGIGILGSGSWDRDLGNGVCAEVSAQPTRAKPSKPQAESAAVWAAYAEAYDSRYHEPPVRNAKVNSQLAQLLRRLPGAEAPEVARHYLRSNNARYVASGHSVGCLLQDAEKLRTEWATGRQGTAHAAREQDKRAGRGEAYREMFDRLDAEDAAAGRLGHGAE